MRLEIVVSASSPDVLGRDPYGPDPSRRRWKGVTADEGTVRQALDVFIDGANVTARVRETHGAFVLRDLAHALVELAKRPRAKATVRFYDEPWELCIERFGNAACLSVYSTGREPVVAVYDRPAGFADIIVAVRESVERVLAQGPVRAAARLELGRAANELAAIVSTDVEAEADIPVATPVVVELDRDSPVSFGAEFAMRERESLGLVLSAARPSTSRVGGTRRREESVLPADGVELSDVHALLFRGRVRADIRGRVIDLGECHPVLFAERLVDLTRRAFDAWERGLAMNARSEAAGILVGIRVSAEGQASLTLGAGASVPRRGGGVGAAVPPARAVTFPALGVADILEASLAFARSLVRAIVRRDRAQTANLRLGALRRAVRESTDALRQANQNDSKINPMPEPYRAFVAALEQGLTAPSTSLGATRLRYAPRWRAIVPAIDLRATYLCGDKLVVGATTEMWAMCGATGKVIWRTDVARGASVVTPAGVARLATDGTLCLYGLENGQRTLRTRIASRIGRPVAGAVVSVPGLPRLLIVTEGEHHIVAVDLTSGEMRWRWSWGGSRGSTNAAPRIKRFGKLVYFACGDSALTAIDAATGAVVWRLRDRLRFRSPPTIARDVLYSVSGGAHGIGRLHCIDPYSGRVRWQAPLADPSTPCTVEGAPLVADGAVAVALRHKTGLSLAAFRPEDGTPIGDGTSTVTSASSLGLGSGRARSSQVVAPTGTSWLAIDDCFIGNTPLGELVAVHARTGELVWRHVLGPRPLEADVPRRLEPVLRCGALFVPCATLARPETTRGSKGRREVTHEGGSGGSAAGAGVAIVRPSDGALIGSITLTEAIPDMLRVDQDCSVFVAEESGHLAAFGPLARLSLVKG
jgi:outer membrane protein assembly factor BamB